MKESLKKRIESIEKKEGSTEKFMYLCGIIGIVDIVFGILSLYLHFWIAAGIFFLIAVRQAIVFPKWRKKLRMERDEIKKIQQKAILEHGLTYDYMQDGLSLEKAQSILDHKKEQRIER